MLVRLLSCCSNSKIAAIKALRGVTSFDLREALQVIDGLPMNVDVTSTEILTGHFVLGGALTDALFDAWRKLPDDKKLVVLQFAERNGLLKVVE